MLQNNDIEQNLETRFRSFDWTYTFYDPLYFNAEITEQEEIQEFERLEELISDLKKVSEEGNEGQAMIAALTEKYRKNTAMEHVIGDLFNHQKIQIMNQQNFEYLKDNIKYMGFGTNLTEVLEASLKQGKPEFALTNATEINKKPFVVTLNFRKSENSDMYFFNNYKASLHRSNGEQVDHTFYLTKGKGITAKEAYNMLEGRAVYKELSNKEGKAYNAWVQLDFSKKDQHNNYEVKQFHENYGYNVKEAANRFSITELADPTKEQAFIQSLQKGNFQSVTIEQNGSPVKLFVEANPQYKTINLYDASFKRIQKEELNQYRHLHQPQEKIVNKEVKEDLKEGKKKEMKKSTEGTALSGKKQTREKKKTSL